MLRESEREVRRRGQEEREKERKEENVAIFGVELQRLEKGERKMGEEGEKHEVIIDSACSQNLFGKREGKLVKEWGRKKELTVKTYQGVTQIEVQEVLVDVGFAELAGYYNETREVTLISVGQLDQLGYRCYFGERKVSVWRGEKRVIQGVLAGGKAHNGVYMIELFQKAQREEGGEQAEETLLTLPEAEEVFYGEIEERRDTRVEDLVHYRIGHASKRRLPKLVACTTGLWRDALHTLGKPHLDSLCTACCLGKASKKPRKKGGERQKRGKWELVHADVFGPTRIPGLKGERYFLVLRDDRTGYSEVFCTRTKEMEHFCKLTADFVTFVQTQTGE